MKNVIKLLLGSFFTAALFLSCTKDENKVYYTGGTNPVLTAASTAALVLLPANAAQTAISFTWTNPNYQFNTGISSQDVTYILQIDTTGSNFTSPTIQEAAFANNLGTSLTVKELNTYLTKLGMLENVTHNIEFRVKSTLLNNSVPLYSNVIKIVVTPYLDVVYPVPAKLYITGSATPASWMGGGDPELVSQRFTKISTTKFELTITLSGGNSYLFVPVYGDWSNKYGFIGGNNGNSTGGDDFKPNGGDMLAPGTTGSRKITVDFKTGKWTVQ